MSGYKPIFAARDVFPFRFVIMLSGLVQTTDRCWMTRPPSRCPNGHELGRNHLLVGHVACLGHGGGGHTSAVAVPP